MGSDYDEHEGLERGKLLAYVKALSKVNARGLSASLGFPVQPRLLGSVYMHSISRDRGQVEYIKRDGLKAVSTTFQRITVPENFQRGLNSYQTSVSAEVYFRQFLPSRQQGLGGNNSCNGTLEDPDCWW
jgi:hypothetical protein